MISKLYLSMFSLVLNKLCFPFVVVIKLEKHGMWGIIVMTNLDFSMGS